MWANLQNLYWLRLRRDFVPLWGIWKDRYCLDFLKTAFDATTVVWASYAVAVWFFWQHHLSELCSMWGKSPAWGDLESTGVMYTSYTVWWQQWMDIFFLHLISFKRLRKKSAWKYLLYKVVLTKENCTLFADEAKIWWALRGTMLTGHCSTTHPPSPHNSPLPWKFPQTRRDNFPHPLISPLAAKNGRSCWRSPTCRSASTSPRRWSRTRTTTSSTSSPSGRSSFASSAKTASKCRFSMILEWSQYNFQLLLKFETRFQETVFPLQQLLGRSVQLRDGSRGEPDLPCTSNFLQIPHHTPRWDMHLYLYLYLLNILPIPDYTPRWENFVMSSKAGNTLSVKPQGRLAHKSLIFCASRKSS